MGVHVSKPLSVHPGVLKATFLTKYTYIFYKYITAYFMYHALKITMSCKIIYTFLVKS